ncbi:hypothetical protein B0J11DRAFT_209505 [Dendryphion nanum]|uniref:Uncharacterized protein n=1 Tax=Dendryphion nanum TaxID=256645 RepID=A0A9P9E4N5_9PLEO|nr:hypothetical protein B0J11DRAFT_209505 [Dendryphion nanum]
MVSFKTIAILTLAHLSATAYAGSCKTFLYYCGHNLKQKGWNDNEIMGKCLADKWNDGYFPKSGEIPHSLFKCAGQGESLVWMNGRQPCGTCINAGAGKSDYCA